MRQLSQWGAIALGTAALLLAVSPASADTFRADIEDFTFTPDPIVIDVGDRVTWTNRGDQAHTVTADDGSFDGEDVDPEETYSRTFRQPGRFPYRCTRHAGMTGTVDVADHTGSGPGTPATTSSTTGPRPATPTAEQAPVTTSPPPPGPSAPATTATTMPMPVLRSSTTSTSAPPAADERVTIPTGEAPVFTPTPEELGAPEATVVPSSTDGAAGGRGGGAGGGDDLGWALVVVLGVGVAGLGRLVLARRTRTPDST